MSANRNIEWAEFFYIWGDKELLPGLTVEDLYYQFDNRFASVNVGVSDELLEPVELIELED